jgi:hypothetical protein
VVGAFCGSNCHGLGFPSDLFCRYEASKIPGLMLSDVNPRDFDNRQVIRRRDLFVRVLCSYHVRPSPFPCCIVPYFCV